MPFSQLSARVVAYANKIDELQTPTDVLSELHLTTSTTLQLAVLGAARVPQKASDWESVRLGRAAFLHGEVRRGWWNEYQKGKLRPILHMIPQQMKPYLWSDAGQTSPRTGRQPDELFVRYGMRDGLTCPVGGRWVVAFWSSRELSNALKKPTVNLVFAAASFAALRLEQLIDGAAKRTGSTVRLSPRELDVLQLVSTGARGAEVARALGIGEETIRSHMKKAQIKLGARSRTHVIAEALRRNLIT
jgi:DNA-binding CsgD family transcriptional regulator